MAANSIKIAAPASCVLVADQHGARLFAARRRRGSHPLGLDEVASHDNALIAHDRGGRPPGTKVRRVTFANPDRDHDVMRDQFAADVVAWVAAELRTIPTDGTLRMIAPPEFLGAMRRALSSHPLAARITEHAADLTHLSTSELERHEAIIHELNPAT